MKILIAYDGSDYADDAITELQRAGLPGEAEAVVLSVTNAWELPHIADCVSSQPNKPTSALILTIQKHLGEITERAQSLSDTAAGRVREMFPDWVVSAEARLGKPAWELIKKSDEWQPELVVVGSHGRTALGQLFLGSVSQKVLTEAGCSVRISRRRANDDNAPLRVLIAVDGSPNSKLAVEAAAKRQWAEGVEIRLITVDDPFTRFETGNLTWDLADDKPDDNEESRIWISEIIEKPTQLLKSGGLNVSHTIKWGDATAAILCEAKEWKADSIFVGARGLGLFKRFFLGSVAAAVAAQAQCSVEVVRAETAE
ncbi:MAG: universal stress protein [Pyrinomonadaceae bacterium]|nr:universal stress protein [Pyrinomonadaceae bacterium]